MTRFVSTTGAANEAAMHHLLAPVGQSQLIGDEQGRAVRNGVAKFVSPLGSTRFVFSEDGVSLAALQVMSRAGIPAVATNVYTDPDSRGRGLATHLFVKAFESFKDLQFSADLTPSGADLLNHLHLRKIQDLPWLNEKIAANGVDVKSNFLTWFQNSKVIDKNGMPLMVYHGSDKSFDGFDAALSGKNYKTGSQKGMCFTADPHAAEQYALDHAGATRPQHAIPGLFIGTPGDAGSGGANIAPVYLSMQNPLIRKVRGIDSPDQWFDRNQKAIYAAAEKAKSDGLIIHSDSHFSKRTMYIVFDAKQIKSAIGNAGLYLKDSESITDHAVAMALEKANKARVAIQQSDKNSRELQP